MAFGKQTGLQGLAYQGGGSMVSWLLNRISGLGILIFVGLHVLAAYDMHVMEGGGDLGTAINTIYEGLPFQIFIYFCVLFHVFHGLRVTLLDLWPQFLRYQREALWLQWGIFIPVYGLTVMVMIMNALAGG